MTRRSLLLGLLLLACDKADQPVDPVWGKEPCAHCAMLVSDRRYAAQTSLDGDRKYFDDVGCMVSWFETHPNARAWVQVDGKWADAKSARYEDGVKTPMDYGWAPISTNAGIGWQDLRERVRARGRTAQ